MPASHYCYHTVRDGVEDRVCQILGGGGEPKVAALTGRSGAGKTTVAAAMVRERGPVHPRPGETEYDARTRLDRLRALFPDGVVGLRVGKGEGAADRLPRLMQELAKTFHEDVMAKGVAAPAVDEAGEGYVKNIVQQESLRCLVVADDVWEEEVVEKLRNTGMWVLLTSRNASIVQSHERVVVDKLTQEEAEDVLRGAAGLPSGERLCDAAMKILAICCHVAMDIAFVGSSVRTTDGLHKSSRAWAKAEERIAKQIDGMSTEGMDDVDVNRLAVLRAGFKYMNEDTQELYMMLAVLPDGYIFGKPDMCVLLDDEEKAMSAITTLERWGVLRADASGLYSMHDAHAEFARERLMVREDVRRPAIDRWVTHISRLEFAISIDVYALLNVWRALERVGGEGLWVTRAYEKELLQCADTERSKMYAWDTIAQLYAHDQQFVELEGLMRRVLEQDDGCAAGSPGLKMTALFHISQSVIIQGRFREQARVTRQLREIVDGTVGLQMTNYDDDPAYASTIFNAYGFCEAAGGSQNEAEKWFRKALEVQGKGGLEASSQAVFTLNELGKCVGGMGRWREAKKFLHQALTILEARLGPNSLQVAMALHVLGVGEWRAGAPANAEELLKRSLEIKEVNLGPNDTQTILTLKELSHCVRASGRGDEADELFLQAVFADLQGTTWIQRAKKILVFLAWGLLLRGLIAWGTYSREMGVMHSLMAFHAMFPFFYLVSKHIDSRAKEHANYFWGEIAPPAFVNGVPIRKDAPSLTALMVARVDIFLKCSFSRCKVWVSMRLPANE